MFTDKDTIFRLPEGSLLAQATGGFARRVFVLAASAPGQAVDREFLVRILAAVQLRLEQDALYAEVPAGEPVSVLPALRDKHAETVMVFGLLPAQVGIHVETPLYQPTVFYGATFLFAEALSVLEPDKARKGMLWQALQQIFRENRTQ